jgi:glycosyltransferase involved in cell wall biosynthesis
MLNQYKDYFSNEYNIIPSIDPIRNAHVYQYWRPQWPKAQRFFRSLPKDSKMYTHGIHMLHDSPYDIKRHNTEQRKVNISNFRYVMCTSMEQYEYYQSLGDSVVYCPLSGLNNAAFPLKLDFNRNKKIRIGFVARLYPDRVKGEDMLQSIASQLSPENFEFVLHVTDMNNKKNVLERNIRSMGFNVLHKSEIDVLLICSKYEGTPLPLIEAISSGTYVLSTSVGDAPTVLPKKQICNTVEDFVDHLHRIESNRSILNEFIETGPSLVSSRTWENFFEKNRDLWESIIK